MKYLVSAFAVFAQPAFAHPIAQPHSHGGVSGAMVLVAVILAVVAIWMALSDGA